MNNETITGACEHLSTLFLAGLRYSRAPPRGGLQEESSIEEESLEGSG